MKFSYAYITKIAVNPLELKTAEVSRAVFDFVKREIEAGRTFEDFFMPRGTLEFKLPINTPSYKFELLQVSIRFQRGKKLFVTEGGTKANKGTGLVSIGVMVTIPRGNINLHTMRESYEILSMSLKETIRHELEHFYQYSTEEGAQDLDKMLLYLNKFDKDISESSGDFGDELRQMKEVNAYVAYLRSPREMEAFTAGIYYRAKKERRSFSEVFDNFFLSGWENSEFKPEVTETFKKGLEAVKKDYIEYAKQRYPDVQV